MSYYPPYKSSSNNVKVELDLTNYTTKTDLKNITHVDVSSVKWTVLTHFESQPRGQNFQAQTYWTVLAHLILDSIKY